MSGLEDHRIRSIETAYLKDRYPRYVGRNSFGKPQAYGGGLPILIVTTDQGASGWGVGRLEPDQSARFLDAPVAGLFDAATGTVEDARVLDLALHDLAGNILGQPVWKLLGAGGPREIPIYSGAIYFNDLEPEAAPAGVEAVVRSCRQDYEAGYRAFKLKIGRGFKWMPPEEGLARDVAVTRAVREAFPDCQILVDANNAYTVAGFLRYLDGVAGCDLYWIEEPFKEKRDDLRRLKEHMAKLGCRALIAEGEDRTERADPPTKYGGYTPAHVDTLYALAAEGLVDVFLLDLGIVGFTRWRHIMPELAAAGIKASPHTWAWCVRPRLVAQLAAGVGNVVMIEGIPGDTAGLDYRSYPLVDGRLRVPDTPGFGLPLIRERLVDSPVPATSVASAAPAAPAAPAASPVTSAQR
ncbi:MAG: mandelate racemase [Chloroflexi bacterium]|nr:mandelate racemase [Chloroflexota bacterium]